MATPYTPPAPLRVACPACGNPVHPVAGRCRHCRVDLARRVDGPALPAAAPARPASRLRPRLGFVAALVVAIAVAVAIPLGLS